MFTTAVAVLIGPAGGRVRWAAAGHPPPRWLDTGQPFGPPPPGVPLGVQTHCNARTRRASGGAGHRGLVLYTDGVLDATGPHGVRFGDARLTRALRELASSSASCAVDELMRTVCHFSAHALPDDAAAAVIRRA
jgi:sigma-B regulation protein RsbU (phosphoserine phosphatase)